MNLNKWVVKLGGSLFAGEFLPHWLAALAEHGAGRIAVVPGGGPFADQVRAAQGRWRFGDAAAHRMAMLGMAQYGMMLSDLQPGLVVAADEDAIRRAWRARQVPVWIPPGTTMRGMRCDWSLTSDSLAAWLAARLRASHLLLVKSIRIDAIKVNSQELARRGVVDSRLAELLNDKRCMCRILAAHDYDLFAAALNGTPVGTAVTHHPGQGPARLNDPLKHL
ncbi:MAG: amino acid kinase [Gammaproteobacteria bacterium]|nr:amino acid kinase [Gammaproteobacteria bacterium]MBA3730797.1 amino acid kinase [Gammaproteobacteria bacterium]